MKKILTLGLILAMALTMFTACSSEEVPSTVSQTVNIAAHQRTDGHGHGGSDGHGR